MHSILIKHFQDLTFKGDKRKEIYEYLEMGVGEEVIVRDTHISDGAWGSEDSYSIFEYEKIRKLVTYYETGEKKTITLFKHGKLDEMIKFKKSGEIEGSFEP